MQTKLDAYLLPRIDKILDRVSAAGWLKKVDLSIAYHCMSIHPGHEEGMIFLTQYGLFKFLVLPFSLMNALATF